MIGHSKHDFGGVTSFESISKFCCDRCCSVIHGGGGRVKKCRKSGERRVIPSQGGKV